MEMSRASKRRKMKRQKDIIKLFGLFCFIILVVIYSYFLLQSKLELEANASPQTEKVQDENERITDNNTNPDTPGQTEAENQEESPEQEDPSNENTELPDDTENVENQVESETKNPSSETTEPQNPSTKTVYLTFDDGPHKVSVDILALLAEYDAKATFFMLDGNIKTYPDAVKQMVEQGHSVGMHGVSHDKNKFYQSKYSVIQEMDKARQTILDITGVDSILIRTPFGSHPHMTDSYRQAVVDAGYKMWDWNIDSRDWYFRDGRFVDSVIEQLNKLEERNTKEPIVILLHERPETLAQLPRLLDYLKSKGYDFKPLDALMDPVQLG